MNEEKIAQIIERIKLLCSEKGYKQKFLFEQLQMSRGLFNDWKHKKSQPTNEVLVKIADILDTTPEYLRGETDIKAKKALKDALTEYEGALLLVTHEPDFADGLCDCIFDAKTK